MPYRLFPKLDSPEIVSDYPVLDVLVWSAGEMSEIPGARTWWQLFVGMLIDEGNKLFECTHIRLLEALHVLIGVVLEAVN